MNYVRNTFFSLALLLLVAPSAFAAQTSASSSSSSSASLSSSTASALSTEAPVSASAPLLSSASGQSSAPAAEGRWTKIRNWMSATKANKFRKDHPYITYASAATVASLGVFAIAYNKSADFKKWVDAKCSSLKAYFNDEKNGKTRKIVAAAVPVGAAAIGGAYLAYKKYKKPVAGSTTQP